MVGILGFGAGINAASNIAIALDLLDPQLGLFALVPDIGGELNGGYPGFVTALVLGQE